MGKLDLIALSQKKGYKIAMIVLAVLGVLIMVVGIVLKLTITPTVMPNQLEIPNNGYGGDYRLVSKDEKKYVATITQDTWLTIDTGTEDKPLSEGIKFVLDDNAKTFLQPIKTQYYGNTPIKILVKENAPDHEVEGVLTIKCGSLDPIMFIITYHP